MKVYFSPSKLSFYPEEFMDDYKKAGTWADDAFLIPYSYFTKFALNQAPKNKELGCVGGFPEWVDVELTNSDIEMSERLWRNSELIRADLELNKVQDSDPKSIGSVSQWREYRKALRAWPESPYFPSKDKRPVSPI